MDFFKKPLIVLLLRLAVGLTIVVIIGITLLRKVYYPKNNQGDSLPVSHSSDSPKEAELPDPKQLPEIPIVQSSPEQILDAANPTQPPKKKRLIQERIIRVTTYTTEVTTITSFNNLVSATAVATTGSAKTEINLK